MAFTSWIEYVQDITRRMTEMKNVEKPEASDMEAYLAYAIKEKRLNQEWEALLTAVSGSGKGRSCLQRKRSGLKSLPSSIMRSTQRRRRLQTATVTEMPRSMPLKRREGGSMR